MKLRGRKLLQTDPSHSSISSKVATMAGFTVIGSQELEPRQREGPPLKSSMWPTEFKGVLVLAWVFVIHLTAVAGLIEYPLPGWRLLLASTVLTLLGGAGATICYHRALAHRSVKLHPAVQTLLIFFAMLCGVTPPG